MCAYLSNVNKQTENMWPSWMSFRWMDGFHHHLFQDIGSLCHFLDFSFFFITRVYIITTNFRYNFFSGHKCDDLWPLSFSLWSAFMFVCSWFFFLLLLFLISWWCYSSSRFCFFISIVCIDNIQVRNRANGRFFIYFRSFCLYMSVCVQIQELQ